MWDSAKWTRQYGIRQSGTNLSKNLIFNIYVKIFFNVAVYSFNFNTNNKSIKKRYNLPRQYRLNDRRN